MKSKYALNKNVSGNKKVANTICSEVRGKTINLYKVYNYFTVTKILY